MQVPFLDLRRQQSEIDSEANSALAGVISSGAFILNGEVESFETEWARFCGVRAAAATNSGTDALALALLASGAFPRGEGHEVITSPLTAGYSALAILSAGGVPVFADIDPRTYTLDPEGLEKAITPRTRAIVPVHIYGQMADMEGICQVAARHGLAVIEDAAQAHAAMSLGKRAGAHGLAAAFSFYPTKNLGAYGDGGAVTSNDVRLCEQVKSLREGGQLGALQGGVTGRNSRLDEIQAAVLRVKLRYLEEWNLRRLNLAKMYCEEFAVKGSRLVLPYTSEAGSHVYHLFVVQHENREDLRAHLTGQGIETMIHYPFLLHQQPLFRRRHQRPLPVAEGLVKRILSLPLYPQLKADELLAVSRAVCEFEEGGRKVSELHKSPKVRS
jgi:dTDP-4-amino-4,6-dideoxygalactose transaminase